MQDCFTTTSTSFSSSFHTPIALITGVSRPAGLGFAVARQLAEKDFHVILAARDENRAADLAGELCRSALKASSLQLDLTTRSSIEAAARHLSSRVNRLDVLINNASGMPDFRTQSALEVDFDVLRSHFEVSVFGCWELVQALLPLLRKAPAARIVNVSSEAAQQIGRSAPGPLYSPAYSLAKYTLNALTSTLAGALADTPILVNGVDPGSVASHPERDDEENDRSPEEAARGVVWAATLGPDGPTGGLFFDGRPVAAGSQ